MSAAIYWAQRYVERLSLALVPLPHACKAPREAGWNTNGKLLRTPDQVHEHWRRHPSDGMGACLEPSGLVSIDCDAPDLAREVLRAEGINLEQLIAAVPTIIGRAPRLEFAAPDGVTLGRKSITWPAKAPGEKPITVLEFRAGRVQDVLPPSIHPDTRKPYAWRTPPRQGFPALPDALLALWLDFDAFARRARTLCSWAPPEPEPVPRPERPRTPRPAGAVSVIAEFNTAHDPATILEAHGYQRAGKRRWKSPNGHGIAGVVQLESGKIFCHHASDTALAGEHALDAFDLFRVLDHDGDYRAATRAAAELLGLTERRRSA